MPTMPSIHGQGTPILALDKPASLFGGVAVSGWQVAYFRPERTQRVLHYG
jgi:hypothetical protein